MSDAVSRREFLSASAALALCSTGNRLGLVDDAGRLGTDEMLELSAVSAVQAMKQGDFTAERYATALLDRCAEGKHLNAFISLDPVQVLGSARAAAFTA